MKHENPFEKLSPRRTGFIAEYWAFLVSTRKWWLAPILLAILLGGLLVFFSSTAAAPFIYTLF